MNGEQEYEVERLLSHRLRRRSTNKFVEVLVRWKGYDPSEDCWVSSEHLAHAPIPLRNYLSALGVEDVTELLRGQV